MLSYVSHVSCSTNGSSVTMTSHKMTKEHLEDEVAEESPIMTGHKFDDGQRKGTSCIKEHSIILFLKPGNTKIAISRIIYFYVGFEIRIIKKTASTRPNITSISIVLLFSYRI